MDGPPEMVDGMVIKVMTSCSLRPANRARNPPMAWIPSCELPAIRMTASETFDIFGPLRDAVSVVSLMNCQNSVHHPQITQQRVHQIRPDHIVSRHTIIGGRAVKR